MANSIVSDPNKELDGATTLGYRFLFELCKSADATDETNPVAGDGAIITFQAQHADFTKVNGNAAVAGDVSAKVDDVAATINSIDASAGTVTLSTAPPSTAVIKLTYKYTEKCHHSEVFVDATDMTNSENATEAKTKAITAATAARTAWIAALAAESTKTAQPALSGDVSL